MLFVVPLFIYLTLPGTWDVLAASSRIVHTHWGDLEGIYFQDEHGNHLDAYLGIPFAEPPVGDLRFKKPVPHPGIKETFNATKQGPACMQVAVASGPKVAFGEEDCLTLNVFVPSGNTTSPRAVMVWIHGGGYFVGGAAWYVPSPLATVGDVIAVTIQYRLGIFGFMSTMDDAAKGNYGLWDQVLALKWIKENIAGFGGDPDQITIIGESSGAASVGFLTTSPEAKGLFKRAILQSGSVTSSWAFQRHPLPITYSIAEQAGCGAMKTDHSSLVACMRAVPAKTLGLLSWPITKDLSVLMTSILLAPVVDREFILEDPHTLLSSPQRLKSTGFSTYDIMLGVNNNEGGDLYGGTKFYDKIFNTTLNNSMRKTQFYKTKILRTFLNDVFGEDNTDMLETAFFEYMFPNSSDAKTLDLQTVYNTKTDAAFLAPAVQFARTHASLNGRGKTYVYYFDHDPNMSLPPEESVSGGMHHAFDVYYTFGFSDIIIKAMEMASNISDAEVSLSVIFRKILTQFAKLGDPSGAVNGLMSGSWPQFNTTTEEYLNFNDHMTVRNHVAQRRVALWLDLLPRLRNAK